MEAEAPGGLLLLEGMARLETKRRRRGGNGGGSEGTGGGHGLGSLTGIGAVQHAFHFLDGPADVLRASIACRRWRELACDDSVFRARAVREGVLANAEACAVAVPGSLGGGGGGMASSEWLAFYAECSQVSQHIAVSTRFGT